MYNPKIYLNLGFTYYKFGDNNSSIKNFLKSLRYDKFNFNSLYNLAITYRV